MKCVFTGKELTGTAEATTSPATDVSAMRELRGGGERGFLAGSCIRVLLVLAVSALVLYICMGTKIMQVVTGALVLLFQTALIELIGGIFRSKSTSKASDGSTRAFRLRRWNRTIGIVEWTLCILVLIVWTIYWNLQTA